MNHFITGRNTVVALLVYYAFFFVFYMPFSPVNQYFLKHIPAEKILDLQEQGYSAAQVRDLLTELKEKGRADYIRNLWTLDLVFPMLALMSSLLLMLYCVRKIDWGRVWMQWIALIPAAVLVLDYLENGLITIMIAQFPENNTAFIHTASLITQMKWMGINVGFMLSVGLVGVLAVKNTVVWWTKRTGVFNK